MPQRQQKQDVDLGQILQLWSAFSPEAQARTQLLQNQATASPQLTAAQVAALQAETQARMANTGLLSAQTAQVAPTAAADIASRNAGTELTQAQTGQVAPVAQSQIAMHQAAAALSQAQTGEVGPDASARRAELAAAIQAHIASAGLTTAQTGEVGPTGLAQRNLLQSETGKNIVGGVVPFIQDKSVAGGVTKEAINALGPQFADSQQNVEKLLRTRQQAMVDDTVQRFGVEKAKTMLQGLPPEMFTPHEMKAGLSQVGINLPITDPFFAQVNQLVANKKDEARQKKLADLKMRLDLTTKALAPQPEDGRLLIPEARIHYAQQRATILQELAKLGIQQ